MDTNKIFIDMAQRAHEFAEMCRLMQKIPDMPLTAEVKDALDEYAKRLGLPKADPEAWREEYLKKQAAGVKFEKLHYPSGKWFSSSSGGFIFKGNKEDYREVPQEVFASECQKTLEHLAKTYSADKGTAQLNPPTPHAAERALWKAQREAGTNEIWQEIYEIGTVITTYPVDKEPAWDPNFTYRVKPMKLTAKIIRRELYPRMAQLACRIQNWEFAGTREEYHAECEKYGYAILSEIKEVVEKPKTVKYYFAMLNRYRCTPFGRAASDKDQIIEYAKKHRYTIIGDIEEREVEA